GSARAARRAMLSAHRMERLSVRASVPCLIAAWLFGAPALAESPPPEAATLQEAHDDVEARVWAWLSAGVESHVSHARFAELGEAGTQALIAIFEREDAPRYVRLRALSALSAMKDREARAYLEALVVAAVQTKSARLGTLHPARSTTVLRRALTALAEQDAAVSMDAVGPCLKHRDPAVRRAAVRVLSKHRTKAIRRALEAQLAEERS